jgi:hypothetical protein
MSTYEVIGQVDTAALKTSYGERWHGIQLTPPFWLTADNEQEAIQLAKDVVDPLHLCTMHLTAKLVQLIPAADVRMLGAELDNAVEALNGDSDDDEEHDALLGMTRIIAGILGVNLDELLDDE